LKVNRIKFAIAIIFVASVFIGLSSSASAYPPFVGKAKKFGAKDCTFCHVDPMGGPPWNDRGKWLIKEKERRNADAINVEWLADYKEGKEGVGKPSAAAKPTESKPSTGAAASTSTGSAEQDLLKLEREWLDAYIKRDAAALERIEADEFSITYPTGEVLTRAQELANLKANGAANASLKFDTEGTKVRLYGDTAVLTGTFIQRSTDKGVEMAVRQRYTDVWVKRNGRWQVAASQLTRIPDQAPVANATPEIRPQTTQGAKVDPKIYDAYVGAYETSIFVLEITREGDKLFGQPQGDSKEELVPETETRFKVTNVNAIVTFVKDAEGKVTGIEIELNGQKVKGKKIK
jgi:ketosteroid isomerase-like protein